MTEEAAAAVRVAPRNLAAGDIPEKRESPVHWEGRLALFVATELDQQVRLSTSRGSGCQMPAIDRKAMQDLAALAVQVAAQVEELMRSVQDALQALTTLSVGCIQTYRDSVESLGDSVDTSIRSMYTLITRCEELETEMQPVPALASRIREMKRTLDRLEGLCK